MRLLGSTSSSTRALARRKAGAVRYAFGANTVVVEGQEDIEPHELLVRVLANLVTDAPPVGSNFLRRHFRGFTSIKDPLAACLAEGGNFGICWVD